MPLSKPELTLSIAIHLCPTKPTPTHSTFDVLQKSGLIKHKRKQGGGREREVKGEIMFQMKSRLILVGFGTLKRRR
ncbi:hypothetical protein TIFTF001_010969 [Ficus carica]|uniref:Uncharacterized protein n=1 Tax=Ficus carica TaxID=3494 RepID=A0AA88D0B2_FICCA|nr:hypothetical protein TIFTF001_010969 [Ficus carica]